MSGAAAGPGRPLVLHPAAPRRVVLDGRRPQPLDHHGTVLQVASGVVDLFAVALVEGEVAGPRRHLFRVEAGGILPPMPDHADGAGRCIRVIAVGGLETEALVLPRGDGPAVGGVEAWIGHLARLVAGPDPMWDILEAWGSGPDDLKAGERRRGPARAVVWVSVTAGEARLMGRDPPFPAGGPPVPLTAGAWLEAGPEGSRLDGAPMPGAEAVWAALDRFHPCVMARLAERLAEETDREGRRLVDRAGLNDGQAVALFSRLAGIVVRRRERSRPSEDRSDPLVAACRTVADTMEATILPAAARAAARATARTGFDDVVAIARASQLRVRTVLLRGEWWRQDVGPLVAWHGEARDPVALIRSGGHYRMTGAGAPRRLDRSLAREIAPEAVAFYPTLPSRALTWRDMIAFPIRHGRGDIPRILLPALFLGLLTLVPPLITQALVDSAIPRSELDQLVFCAAALGVTALAMAMVQTVEAFAMLRLEGQIDWKLQAAMIDRLLRLPASLFRAFTVGDLVDRAMGIDAVRRIFTGRTLRSLMTGMFCWFSIGLMLAYDAQLALIAIALSFVRALFIVVVSGLRLHYESRHFALRGRVSGFVLQLLSGIGKLRVADAKIRALAVWSRDFAAQKRHFLASQRAENLLNVVETAYPPLATLVIFAAAGATGGGLTQNLGAFLAFFAAFGQTMASIGAWASGMSESLVAIPHFARMRPLIAGATEISDDRKPPGDLAGAIELSRVTFRYLPGGPPVLDAVSLRIAPGEYVAIVGPSGSGKSSLFRLLLGFETPESGAVFFDGKSLDTLDTSAVRRQLGVVLQNGRLATGSLYDNICGGVQLPLAQAWEAARLAGLEPDIKALPMGLHTLISEGVNTFSGGQRQRIMIARAIARRPRILLLDEATSALDNQSQSIVSASLGALNVTRVVIAHRLSTVREADRIVVLVDGKVVQTGTYKDLSEAAGMFAAFTQRQLL